MLQGGRNSGRVVATMKSGASAPRSAMPRRTSSVVGSAQCRSSNASTTGCTLRAGHHPVGQRRQLPAPQFLGRQSRRALLRQRNVEERREQGSVLRRVELDLRQRAFQLGKPPLRRHVGAAETLAAPFGDRMQRRVLQKLRAAPLDPGVRRVGEPGVKFLDQARFTEPRLADDHHQLAVALPRPLPAPQQHRHFIVAADQRREIALRRAPAAAARAHQPEQRRRLRARP